MGCRLRCFLVRILYRLLLIGRLLLRSIVLGNAARDLIAALLLRITRCRCRTVLRQSDRQRQHHQATGDAQADHAEPGGPLACSAGRQFDGRCSRRSCREVGRRRRRARPPVGEPQVGRHGPRAERPARRHQQHSSAAAASRRRETDPCSRPRRRPLRPHWDTGSPDPGPRDRKRAWRLRRAPAADPTAVDPRMPPATACVGRLPASMEARL